MPVDTGLMLSGADDVLCLAKNTVLCVQLLFCVLVLLLRIVFFLGMLSSVSAPTFSSGFFCYVQPYTKSLGDPAAIMC